MLAGNNYVHIHVKCSNMRATDNPGRLRRVPGRRPDPFINDDAKYRQRCLWKREVLWPTTLTQVSKFATEHCKNLRQITY